MHKSLLSILALIGVCLFQQMSLAVSIPVSPVTVQSTFNTGTNTPNSGTISLTNAFGTTQSNVFAYFDVPTAVGAGATITSATLDWNYSTPVTSGATVDYQLWTDTAGTLGSGTWTVFGFQSPNNVGGETLGSSGNKSGSAITPFSVLGDVNATDFFGIQLKVNGNTTASGVIDPASFVLTLDGTGGNFAPPNAIPVADASATADTSFNADQTSLTLDPSNSTDGDGDTLSYTFTPPGSGGADTSATTVALALTDSGLTNTQDSVSLNLSVADGNGGADDLTNANGPGELTLTYDNAASQIDSTGSSVGVAGTNVQSQISDNDLDVDASLADFEKVDWLFAENSDGSGQNFGDGTETNDGLNDIRDIAGFVPDTFTGDSIFLLVNDLENPNSPLVEEIFLNTQVVPEPASIAIWSLLALCLGGYLWRRKNA